MNGEKYSVRETHDPFEGWSEERSDEYWRACEAFQDGDPEPLGAYLRKGYRVDHNLSVMLASAIDPDFGPVRLTLQRVGPARAPRDRRPWSEQLAKYQEDLRIGIDAYRRLKVLGRGAWTEEIKVIAKDHGVGTTRVTKALALVRRQLKYDQGPAPLIDMVTLCRELPGEFSGGKR